MMLRKKLKHKAKWYHRCIAGLFLLMLVLPLLQMVFQFYDEPENVEKRKLALTPQLKEKTVEDVHQYLYSFQLWFNDHFGLRKFLVRTNALINYEVLHTSPKSMVVVGQKGWLFYDKFDDGKNLVDFYGKANFTGSQLSQIHARLDTFQNRMKQLNIPVLIVFIPNKHSIYPEYLPYNFPKKRAAKTRADQIDSMFSKNNIPYINLYSTLIRAKNTYPYPLYYRTDSHWNNLGSHVGYVAIMNEIQKQIPNIVVHPLTDYDVQVREAKSEHDLANLIYLGGVLNDFEISVEPRFKPNLCYTNEKWTTPVKVFSNKDTTLPHMLMFQDSYAISLRAYLAESFSRSTFVWSNPSYPIIKKEKPDLLIIEFVERFSDVLLKM